jgi:hypothetical protein
MNPGLEIFVETQFDEWRMPMGVIGKTDRLQYTFVAYPFVEHRSRLSGVALDPSARSL